MINLPKLFGDTKEENFGKLQKLARVNTKLNDLSVSNVNLGSVLCVF